MVRRNDDGRELFDVRLEERYLEQAEDFKYLRWVVEEYGGLEKEIGHPIQAGWMNWRCSEVIKGYRYLWQKDTDTTKRQCVRRCKTVVGQIVYSNCVWSGELAYDKKRKKMIGSARNEDARMDGWNYAKG